MPAHFLYVHCGVSIGVRGAFLDEIVQSLADGAVDNLIKICLHLWVVAMLYGCDHQIFEGIAIKSLAVAKHVEQTSIIGFVNGGNLVEQFAVDFAFASVLGHKIPQRTRTFLPDTMDASEPLLDTIRVPWQVIVDHEIRALQIQSLPCRVGRHKNTHLWIVDESFLHGFACIAVHTAMDDLHRLRLPQQCSDAILQIVQGIPMLREYDKFMGLFRCAGIQHIVLQDIAELAPLRVQTGLPYGMGLFH